MAGHKESRAFDAKTPTVSLCEKVSARAPVIESLDSLTYQRERYSDLLARLGDRIDNILRFDGINAVVDEPVSEASCGLDAKLIEENYCLAHLNNKLEYLISRVAI
jgi:hypothetical protein